MHLIKYSTKMLYLYTKFTPHYCPSCLSDKIWGPRYLRSSMIIIVLIAVEWTVLPIK